MKYDDGYEEITQEEADFILDLYQVIKAMVYNDIDVTLVGLAFNLGVRTTELSDYLPTIVIILDKIEEELEVQQRGN